MMVVVVMYLVSLDGSNLLVLLDVVADLYNLVRRRWRRILAAILTF